MKLGVENKKQVYVLVGLGVLAAYMVYSQLLSGPSSTPAPSTTARDTVAIPEKAAAPDISRATEAVAKPKNVSKEFHPVLRSKKKEDRPVITGDPSLRLDLLTKVMKVPQAGASRDLFQIQRTPPVTASASLPKGPEPKVFVPAGPRTPPPPPGPPPPAPPPPVEPIPLRYYGYSALHPDGSRTAYFLTPGPDGEEIVEAKEGTVVKGRYRIVQIGLDRVMVEDTLKNRRQAINIDPEVTG
jgi:hypothetical protein